MSATPFVGRAHELALIEEAVTRADTGHGELLLVSGPPGIGKTRLAEEAVSRSQARGIPTAWGRCWPEAGAPPLWPWPAVLERLGGPSAAALLTDDACVEDVDPERFARFRAVADQLRIACRGRPSMVVVDDAHCADVGALLLARYLARSRHELPMVMILSYRAIAEDLASHSGQLILELEADATSIELGPLTPAETAEFLDVHDHRDTEPGMVAAIHRVTRGNPLFLRRLVLLGSGATSPDLQAGVRGAIAETLRGFDPVAATLLARVAVLGPSPSLREAAAVAGAPEAEVVATLREAHRAGLVDFGAAGELSLPQELVRQAIIEQLDPAEVLSTHSRAAQVICARSGADPESLARGAHHALSAARRSPDDAARAVDACRAAARAMTRGFAYEQAATLLERAASVAEDVGGDSERSALLVEWAEAVLRCGRMAQARSLFGRASQAADAAGSAVDLGRAALGIGGVWLGEHRTLDERAAVAAVQRRALRGLPIEEVALRCRLGVRIAAESAYPDGPLESLRAAVDEARDLGDDEVLAEALSLLHHAVFTPRHTWDRLGVAEELVAVASAAGDGLLTLMGLCWRAVDLFLLGDQRAERALAELRVRADALDCLSMLYVVRVIDVMLLVRAGRLDKAETDAIRCFDLGVEVGDADAMGCLGGQLLAIRWLQGRQAELMPMVEEIAESPSRVADEFAFAATAAFIAAGSGDHQRARHWLDRVVSQGLESLPQSSTWLAGMLALAEAACLLGDRDAARRVAALLEPYAQLAVMPSLAVADLGSVERPLGLVALLMGDLDGAVQHLEDAIEADHRRGNRPVAAISQADLADVLARRQLPGDLERAIDLLDEAHEVALASQMTHRGAAMDASLTTLTSERGDVERAPRSGAIRRCGSHWTITLDARQAVVADLVGMRYLAQLLASPGVDVSALRLAGGHSDAIAAIDAVPQDVLDAHARAELRRRIDELRDSVGEAERLSDRARAAQLQAELDGLVEAVREATGLRGRSRTFAAPAERARTAVRKAIKRAIDEIAVAEPTIADHLRETVTTGVACRYDAGFSAPVAWTVERIDRWQ